jgi:mRNA-decapping enzyme 1B
MSDSQQQLLTIEQTRKQANLRLLQRTCNASIADILQTATHVVLYEFINQAWAKCPVEGSLFLTSTAAGAASASSGSLQQHELVILNRHSAENFQMKISWDLQMQDQDPYLIFKQPPPVSSPPVASPQLSSHDTKIQGIWFHNTLERLAVARIIETVLHALRNPTAAPAPAPPPAVAAAAASAAAGYNMSSIFQSSSAVVAPDGQATQDEREHLAALLSQTAVAVTSGAASAPAVAVAAVAAVGGGGQRPPTAAAAGSIAASATATAAVGTASSRSSSAGSSTGAGIALDKKSLQLALLSLIQDDRFLDLLHSQYLRVVHARSKKNATR